jgi:hypothetical protein
MAALKRVCPRHRADLNKLIRRNPQEAWVAKCRFVRACELADRCGSDMAEMCDLLIGTTNLFACLPLIEALTTVDLVAVPVEHTDSVVVDFARILDRRAAIRQSRSYQSQAGPPPPSNDVAPGWRPRAASAHCWARSYAATPPRYAAAAAPVNPAARKSLAAGWTVP